MARITPLTCELAITIRAVKAANPSGDDSKS
jgi:hypothetical protein